MVVSTLESHHCTSQQARLLEFSSWLEEAVSEKKEKKKQDDFALAC